MLPPRVAALLERLLDSPGEVVGKEELIEHVWPDTAVSDNSLSEAVRVLRRILDDDPRRPDYVQTLSRRGYRFVAEVTEADVSLNGGVTAADDALEPAGPPTPVAVLRGVSARRAAVGVLLFVASLALIAAWLVRRATPGDVARLERVELTSTRAGDPAFGAAAPEVSPDGQWLAYATDDFGIRIYNVTTGEERVLHEPSDANPGRVRNEQRVWSADGRSIAFIWRDPSTAPEGWQVRVVDLATGDWEIIYTTTSEQLVLHDWSVDDQLLLRASPLDAGGRSLGEWGAYVELPVGEGLQPTLPPPLLRLDGPDRGARYSPDGSRFVYAVSTPDSSATTIYIGSRDPGVAAVAVGPAGARDHNPFWSPDGSYVAWERRRDTSTDILVAAVGDGTVGEPELIESADPSLELVDWLAASGIVYRQHFVRRSLWRLPIDPDAVDQLGEPEPVSELLAGDLGAEYLPSASGERFVVFDRPRGDQPLLLSTRESSAIPVPTDYQPARLVGWGPQDEWIIGIARREPGGPLVLFRLDPNSGEVVEGASLGNEPLHFFDYDLSPDGRYLSAHRGRRGPADDLELVAIDTDSGEVLGLGVYAAGSQTSWAPDSSHLAALVQPHEGPWALIIVSRAGEQTLIAEFPDACCDHPTWSPDGRWIAVRSQPPGAPYIDIVAHAADGSGQSSRRLARYDAREREPGFLTWSRDGRGIFTMFSERVDGLWAIRNVVAHLEAKRVLEALTASR